jgi:hypothetical protein
MDLRPLTLAELLDRAISIYRRHLWVFVGVMAPPAAFAMLAAIGLQISNAALISQGGVAHPSPEVFLKTIVPFIALTFVAAILNIVAYTLAVGAMTVTVSQIYLGREATVRSAYAAVKGRAARLLLLMVLVLVRVFGAFIGGGMLFAVVAGGLAALGAVFGPIGPILGVLGFLAGMLLLVLFVFFLMTRYSMSVSVLMLEDSPASASIRRSIDLTRENLGRVFLVILCALVVAYATGLLLQGPFVIAAFIMGGPVTMAGQALAIAGAMAAAIGQMFSGPVMMIGLVLMYYDLRIRKEAFDLHMMLEALER